MKLLFNSSSTIKIRHEVLFNAFKNNFDPPKSLQNVIDNIDKRIKRLDNVLAYRKKKKKHKTWAHLKIWGTLLRFDNIFASIYLTWFSLILANIAKFDSLIAVLILIKTTNNDKYFLNIG